MSEGTDNSKGDLFSKIKDYISIQIDLIKLKSIGRLSTILPNLISSVIIFLLFLLIGFLISIGLSLYIGHKIGNTYMGFFIVSGLYILLIIVLIIFKKWVLKRFIREWIIKNLSN